MKTVVLVAVAVVAGCAVRGGPHIPTSATVLSVQIVLIGGNKCTTFSVNEARGFWLTTNHCWEDGPILIGNVPATVEDWDASIDALLLRSPLKAPALYAGHTPDKGHVVEIIGFPLWWTVPISIFGFVSTPLIRVPDGHGTIAGDVSMTQACGTLGMSGAPALLNGRVVGMMRGGFQKPCLDTLAPIAALKKFVGLRWERPPVPDGGL